MAHSSSAAVAGVPLLAVLAAEDLVGEDPAAGEVRPRLRREAEV